MQSSARLSKEPIVVKAVTGMHESFLSQLEKLMTEVEDYIPKKGSAVWSAQNLWVLNGVTISDYIYTLNLRRVWEEQTTKMLAYDPRPAKSSATPVKLPCHLYGSEYADYIVHGARNDIIHMISEHACIIPYDDVVDFS